MPALSEYTNVYDTAIKILQSKGYRIWIIEEPYSFACEKEGWDFIADSPCSLLGLVAIYEEKAPIEYSEYWWKEKGVNEYRRLTKEKPIYRSVVEKPV